MQFLFDNHQIARASLDGGQPVPTGREIPLSRIHIRMLLGQIRPDITNMHHREYKRDVARRALAIRATLDRV